MNKQWKLFAKLSEQCYSDMASGKIHLSIWDQCYQQLKDIMQEEREQNPEYAQELYEIDDNNDFLFGVEEWLLDYQDMLDTMREHKRLQTVCEELIAMFQWREDSPTNLRFHIMIALQEQEKYQEAYTYGERWYQEESDNPYAAAALIYARMGVDDFKGAEEVVERFIPEGTACSEENDVLFGAAEKLYERTKNQAAEERIAKALELYDQELEALFDQIEDEELFF